MSSLVIYFVSTNKGCDTITANVQGLLLWGIVAVSAPAANLIKETNNYLKRKAD